MSHASVLVALPPGVTDVEAAVAAEMEPFHEDGEWFKDGSRWDWYVIGGRFTGHLDGYDPEGDERNFATCGLCKGTGKRTDMEVKNGCNACGGSGTARNFFNAEHSGDIQIKRDVNIAAIAKNHKDNLIRRYARAMEHGAVGREFLFGVKDGESIEEFVARSMPNSECSIAHHAFLRNRHWHEAERLGWFGTPTATECERKAESADVETMIRRCKHKDEKTGASIVVWNEPWEIWGQEFYRRFVEPLPDDAVLVTVDYHV